MARAQVHAGEYVAFVKYFYETSMDKNAADDLASYLEPDTTGVATNYSNISINSTLGGGELGNPEAADI